MPDGTIMNQTPAPTVTTTTTTTAPDPSIHQSWWQRNGRALVTGGGKMTAGGAVIYMLFWVYGDLVQIVRENNAAMEVRHQDQMIAARSADRFQATQIELTRELTVAVRENSAESRLTRTALERFELALSWFGFPIVPKKKDGLP